MNRIFIWLVLTVCLPLFSQDENVSAWSAERLGLRVRMVTEKKEYSLGEKIPIKFEVEKSPLDEGAGLRQYLYAHSKEVFELILTNLTDNKTVPLTKAAYSCANPYDAKATVLSLFLKPFDVSSGTFYHMDSLNEVFVIDKAGKYRLDYYKWVYLVRPDHRVKRMALLKVPPLYFKIKADRSDRIPSKVKTYTLQDFYKKIPWAERDKTREQSIQWSDGPFGLKYKAYITHLTIDCKNDPTVPVPRPYLHLIIRNPSKNITPALEYGRYRSEELFNIKLFNETTKNTYKVLSRRGLMMEEWGLNEIIYYLDKLNPGEERHLRVALWGLSRYRPPVGMECITSSFEESGDYILNAKRRVYYSPDGKYNADTTEGQRELLRKLQMKELELSFKFKVINLPKIEPYEPPSVRPEETF